MVASALLLLACATLAWAQIDQSRRARLDAVALASVQPMLDVNAASADALRLLPRVGATIAERIIDEREQNGPFATVDDLQRVRGIGPRTVERIRPMAVAR